MLLLIQCYYKFKLKLKQKQKLKLLVEMIVAVVAAAVHHLLLKYKLHLQLQFHLFQNNLVALLDNIGQMDLALLILLLIIYLQNAHQALKVMDMEIVFLLHQD